MDSGASFGAWLKRRRRVLDLTQEALAERVGCSVATIQKIEADERRPSRQIAELLAQHLAIPSADHAAFLKVARGERRVDRWVEAAPTVVPALPPISPPPLPKLPLLPVSSGDPLKRDVEQSPPSVLTCPVLIGRIHEMQQLDQSLHAARAGRGGSVLLAGEAGVGKSRLVTALTERAANDQFTTLLGHCYEQDVAFPYAPWIDLLRAFCSTHPDRAVADLLGPAAAELIALLPELGLRLPAITPAPALEPEQEKHRLFGTLAQLLLNLTHGAADVRRPLLIIVEDLHWCDDTSLDFALHLARRLTNQTLLFVLTYRDDEASPRLRRFLAEIDRARLALEVKVPSFKRPEIEVMLRTILKLPAPVRADFVAAIDQLTEGNPFFIEEVLKSLAASGEIFYQAGIWDRKPLSELHTLQVRSIQDAVQRRVTPLSDRARQVLVLAAVMGRRFDFALLLELTGDTERELVLLLKELIEAQLVVEESADHFQFRHALTQQTSYGQLLTRERQHYHRLIAEALERRSTSELDAHVAELAYHFYAARQWAKTLEYARRAGEKAQALFATREAIGYFSQALEAAAQLGSAPPAPLYRARARVYEVVGEIELARLDHEAALAAARADRDPRAEWHALLDLGFLWASRDYARAGDYFRQALAAARALNEPALLAQSLNRLGNWHMNMSQLSGALRQHHEALALFEALQDAPGIADTLGLLGVTLYSACDVKQALAYFEQALAQFQQLNDRIGLVHSLLHLTLCAVADTEVLPYRDLARPIALGEEAVQLAHEMGWLSGEANALEQIGVVALHQGDYDRSFRASRTALEMMQEIGHRQWASAAHLGLGALYFELFDWTAARQHLEQGLVLARDTHTAIYVDYNSAFLASGYALHGDPKRAVALLDEVLPPDQPVETITQRRVALARVEVEALCGQPDRALAKLDQLIQSTVNLTPETIVPRLWATRGEILIALQRHAEATATLEAAQHEAQAQGRLPLVWRIQISLGKVYRALKRVEEAAQEFEQARRLIEELASRVSDETLRENFAQQATALIPNTPALSPRRAARKEFGGLTERERDVAVHIARGKSNREIAETLVVAERTVAAHIGNILNKLGFNSRAQIAAWATAKGLVSPEEE